MHRLTILHGIKRGQILGLFCAMTLQFYKILGCVEESKFDRSFKFYGTNLIRRAYIFDFNFYLIRSIVILF